MISKALKQTLGSDKAYTGFYEKHKATLDTVFLSYYQDREMTPLDWQYKMIMLTLFVIFGLKRHISTGIPTGYGKTILISCLASAICELDP